MFFLSSRGLKCVYAGVIQDVICVHLLLPGCYIFYSPTDGLRTFCKVILYSDEGKMRHKKCHNVSCRAENRLPSGFLGHQQASPPPWMVVQKPVLLMNRGSLQHSEVSRQFSRTWTKQLVLGGLEKAEIKVWTREMIRDWSWWRFQGEHHLWVADSVLSAYCKCRIKHTGFNHLPQVFLIFTCYMQGKSHSSSADKW